MTATASFLRVSAAQFRLFQKIALAALPSSGAKPLPSITVTEARSLEVLVSLGLVERVWKDEARVVCLGYQLTERGKAADVRGPGRLSRLTVSTVKKGQTPADEGIAAAREDDRRRAAVARWQAAERSFDDWRRAALSKSEDTPETRYLGALQLLSDADVVHLLTLSPAALFAAIRCTAATRGINETGRWVGFRAAALIHRSATVEG